MKLADRASRLMNSENLLKLLLFKQDRATHMQKIQIKEKVLDFRPEATQSLIHSSVRNEKMK